MTAKCVVCDSYLHCKVEPCEHGKSVAWYCPKCELLSVRDSLAKMRDENYSDLLDQMDAAWGTAREIGREEINAFLESRVVHKPTTRLRTSLALAEKVVEWVRNESTKHDKMKRDSVRLGVMAGYRPCECKMCKVYRAYDAKKGG